MGTVLPHREGKVFLSDLGKFIKGRGITRADLVQSGIPCLRYGDLYTTYGDVTEELTSFVSEDTARRATPLHHGDIIFAASGETAGEIGKAVAWLGNGTAVAGGDTIILRGHGQDPTFLAHALNAHDAAKQKSRLGKGHSVVHIHEAELAKVSVFLPPISDQRKIGEILRTWDEAIGKLEMLIERGKRLQLAFTDSLIFGRRRLSQFKKTDRFRSHRWFALPEEWNCLPIGKLAKEVTERNDNHLGKIEVLSCSKHEGFVRSLDYFNKQVYSSNLTGYKTIYRGDFGFPSNHVEEGSIGLQDIVDIGVVSPIYTVFRFAPEKIDRRFAISVLKSSLYRHIFEISTSASVDRRGSLRWKEFEKIPFPVPPRREQESISEILGIHSRKLTRLENQRDTYTRQKRGLIQKFLTGRMAGNGVIKSI